MSDSETDDDYGAALATVAGSDPRRKVLRHLVYDQDTPARIAEATDIVQANVSRALNELREVGAVELLVPEDTKKGRLYAATDRGEELAEEIGVVGERE